MTFSLSKGGNLCNVMTNNIIWANQKTELFLYRWLDAHAFFPSLIRALDVILSVLSIR